MKQIYLFCIFLFTISCSPKDSAINNIKIIYDKTFEKKLYQSIEQSVKQQETELERSSDFNYKNNFKNAQHLLLNSFKSINNFNFRSSILKEFISNLSKEDTINCEKLFIIEKRVKTEKISNTMHILICRKDSVIKKIYTNEGTKPSFVNSEVCRKLTPFSLSEYFNTIKSSQECSNKDYCNLDYYYISKIENNIIVSKSIFYLCGSSSLVIE